MYELDSRQEEPKDVKTKNYVDITTKMLFPWLHQVSGYSYKMQPKYPR